MVNNCKNKISKMISTQRETLIKIKTRLEVEIGIIDDALSSLEDMEKMNR